jgi:2'-5' RNA ligase superfamily
MEIAPIILTATMGPEDQSWADRQRSEYYPAERNVLNAHITLFHHLPPTSLPELKARIAMLTAQHAAPNAYLSEIINLGRGVAYRVESAELMALREDLAHAFHGLLTPQDMAKPRLHITVQNKVVPAIATKLLRRLEKTFVPRPLSIIGLSAFHYQGGPWSNIAHWKFRGHRR